MAAQRFCVLGERVSICRLTGAEPVPSWASGSEFLSITRTANELSIVCPEESVPGGIDAVSGYRVLALVGPFPLTAVGILLSFAEPLAREQISILAIGTFDTDYLLVRSADLERAIAVLCGSGHELVR
ncbi:MAG: ACT domain-containing protein [Thermoanaerobaculia bacterium]